MADITLLIHGGAGTISRGLLTPEKENAYREGLNDALQKGFALLTAGHSAMDAVEAAVVALEDCHLFNAGKGSVFTNDGNHEMDASIMDGRTLAAGAVAGVTHVRNPVRLARSVMEKSDHVFLFGEGAEIFARENSILLESREYFFDQYRFEQYREAKAEGKVRLDHSSTEKKFGTVGAVAIDHKGNLAAATSTGGMTNKKYNRVGDTPVIGAGTYANNRTCAVSCTGHGEYFLRAVVAYDISCLIEYRNLSLQEACELVILKKLKDLGGEGGVIALDARSNAALTFNSEGMYRGLMTASQMVISIYE